MATLEIVLRTAMQKRRFDAVLTSVLKKLSHQPESDVRHGLSVTTSLANSAIRKTVTCECLDVLKAFRGISSMENRNG